MRYYEYSQFSFLPYLVAILGPLSFHINFRINLSMSWIDYIACWNFNWDCSEFTDQITNNYHMNNSEFSIPWTWNNFPFFNSPFSSFCFVAYRSYIFIQNYFFWCYYKWYFLFISITKFSLPAYRKAIDHCINIIFHNLAILISSKVICIYIYIFFRIFYIDNHDICK